MFGSVLRTYLEILTVILFFFFFFFAGSNANNLQDPVNSMGNVQSSTSTTGESRIPRPSHLAEVLQSTRQLLTGEVADCLSVCPSPFVFCPMKSYLNAISIYV